MNDKPQEELKIEEVVSEAEMKVIKHDAQALHYASEAAAHPIDQLCGSLMDRINALRVQLDSLETEINLRKESYHKGRNNTLDFVKEAMTQLAALPRVTSALQAVIQGIPNHPSPGEPEPGPAEGPMPPDFVRRVRQP